MSFLRDFRSSAASHRAPGTVGLIVALVLIFLLEWSRSAPQLIVDLVFISNVALQQPWTFLTYAFAGSGGGDALIGLVFLCWWIWGIGGTVERELGTGRYLGAWFTFSALCALGLWLGAFILGRDGVLTWGWTPVAALTILWGTRHPETTILMMFVIPIKAKYVAWLSAGLVFFSTSDSAFGAKDPVLAPFAAAPLIFAYVYAADKLPLRYSGGGASGRSTPKDKAKGRYHVANEKQYFTDVRKREQERQEKERLRKLFESSLDDSPEDKK